MNWSCILLAVSFVGAGIGHFVAPTSHLAIMPPYIPWPAEMVAITGVAEIAGGIRLCFRATRIAAGWGLSALLVAVFPANIHAISTGMVLGGHVVPAWMLWVRLPFQPLIIAWVYRACLSNQRRCSRASISWKPGVFCTKCRSQKA